MKKKILTVSLSIGLAFGLLSNTSYASANTTSIDEVDKILVDFGYDKDDLAYYHEERKIKLAEAIKINPESVSKETTYMRVDNIGLIEYYTNTSDQKLSEDGFEQKQIEKIRKKLDKLKAISESELMATYNLSKGEAKLIKKALKKNPNYKLPKKYGKKEVTTSGTISTSDLSFTMSVVNRSTSTAPSYDVDLHHNWKSPFFFDIVSDNVAAAWGGNLDVKNVGGLTFYYNGNFWTGYKSPWGSLWTYGEVTPNTGIVFAFKQSKDYGSAQAKSGNYWFTVFQTKKQGYSTSIVSQYAHKIATVSNVTVSKTPGINIGWGFDKSPQQRINIIY